MGISWSEGKDEKFSVQTFCCSMELSFIGEKREGKERGVGVLLFSSHESLGSCASMKVGFFAQEVIWEKILTNNKLRRRTWPLAN